MRKFLVRCAGVVLLLLSTGLMSSTFADEWCDKGHAKVIEISKNMVLIKFNHADGTHGDYWCGFIFDGTSGQDYMMKCVLAMTAGAWVLRTTTDWGTITPPSAPAGVRLITSIRGFDAPENISCGY